MKNLENDLRATFSKLQRRVADRLIVTDTWQEAYVREYLAALGRGSEYAVSQDQYPGFMELHQDVHAVLNRMRAETYRDGHERWALIGLKADRRSIYLPTVNDKGERRRVPPKVIESSMTHAKSKGIEAVIGSLHSHPVSPEDYLFGSQPRFSPDDLYWFINGSSTFVMGVVDGETNLFAFASAETKATIPSYALSQESFAQYWYSYAREDICSIGGTSIGELEVRNHNIEIARRHKLVLYQGEPDQKLLQIFPRAPQQSLLANAQSFLSERMK